MKEIQEIAERLKGIREMEEISTAEMAECAGISENEYIHYESGKKDFTFTLLYNCAKKLGIDITELLLGKSPNLSEYSIVRAGYGMKLKRREGFEYLHVAQYMKNRIAEPFVVTAPYIEEEQDKEIHLSSHKGLYPGRQPEMQHKRQYRNSARRRLLVLRQRKPARNDCDGRRKMRVPCNRYGKMSKKDKG